MQSYLDEKVYDIYYILKAVYLKSDIQTDSKIRVEQIETITTSLENDLPKLYEMIKGESGEREV